MMKNKRLAQELEDMADYLELEKVQWKPRAYRQAAAGIRNLDKDAEEIYEEKGKKGLQKIQGIGSSIADHIAEYFEKKRISKLRDLRMRYPKDILKIARLEGLGPSKTKDLMEKLDIGSIKDLRKALEGHRIRDLEGFGKKTEENIRESLGRKDKKRMHIGKAMDIADEVIDNIKDSAEQVDYAGSLRRGKETIGDIDILARAKDNKKIMDAFTNMDNVEKIVSRGKTKSTVIMDKVQIDLRIVPKSSYASALMYFTGSKDHNIEIRKIANRKGWKLSEYGLSKTKARSEKEIYNKLGMDYIPPELREKRGEIEAAKKGRLPKLVKLKDIKGDLQMHTRYSDGLNNAEDMAKKAESLGYEYIAITDHSKSLHMAGMNEKDLKKQQKEIDKLRSKVRIFKSSEVEIKKDGSLDYPDKVLKELDLVCGAVHSNMKMKDMTKRLLKALDNRYLDILVHPTGRMINKRDTIKADFSKVFDKAAERGIILEINSQPDRLDLNDLNIMAAKQAGCRFSISTDAHSPKGMEMIRYGIGQARRGWLEKKDIINTMSPERFRKEFEIE